MEWRILSFQQPWLELVVRGLKSIENRKLLWSYRGGVLLHASASVPGRKFHDACERARGILNAYAATAWERFRVEMLDQRIVRGEVVWCPGPRMHFGGIVGRARFDGVIPKRTVGLGDDPEGLGPHAGAAIANGAVTPDGLRWWFRDQNGYVLRDIAPLPLTPWKGGLGLRKAPADLLARLGLAEAA